MKLTFLDRVVLIATGIIAPAALFRQTTSTTPEPLTVAVWGLALIALSGGLRIALRKPLRVSQPSVAQPSFDQPPPPEVESANLSATQAA